VTPARLEHKASKAILAQLAQLAQWDHKDSKAIPEQRVPPALKDLKAFRV
jgi:hypothetical protein